MNDHRTQAPEDDVDEARETRPKPVPRDLPDQQTGADEDPWELDDNPAADELPDAEVPDPELPDTDEAGTGRRGAPHSGSRRPEHPVPDEPSA